MTKFEEFSENLSKHQSVWLITGVAGFIGSNLLEKLLILNQKVIGLDNFDTGFQSNIDLAIKDAEKLSGKSLSANFNFINGDIKNLKDCQLACTGVDYVLHQAALGSVPRSIDDPINTNSANIDGFLNMLVASKDANVRRFVYAASSSTYGDHPDLPKVEEKIGNPLSPYAVTKLVNELYAQVFATTYGFKTIGLRYFNIFGKRQSPNSEYAAVIPKWIGTILNEKDVFINGDGTTSRDFCYIDNAVQMNLLAAKTQNAAAVGQVYNVALNDQTNLKELYYLIEQRLIDRKKVLKSKQPLMRDFRVGDIMHSRANIDKAKKLLGYEPIFNISKGLDETIEWYVNNLK